MTSAYPSVGTVSQAGTGGPNASSIPTGTGPHPRRLSTETKASFKTSELFVYLSAVVGVLVASWAVGTGDGHDDYFRADRAWFLVVLLTIGYLVSRGLAKSGSRERYDDHR